MLLERTGDIKLREEAEEILNEFLDRSDEATFYAGESRIVLQSRKVVLVLSELGFGDMAQADQKNGRHIVTINLPMVAEKVVGKRVRVRDLTRSSVRRLVRILLRNHVVRSLIVHEIAHVLMRMKGVQYQLLNRYRNWIVNGRSITAFVQGANDKIVMLNTGSKAIRVRRDTLDTDDNSYIDNWVEESGIEYANNREEINSWFNQAVYDITYRARSNFNPISVVGKDPVEFSRNVARFLDEYGWWDKYTEESKRQIRKRAYTNYQDALMKAGA